MLKIKCTDCYFEQHIEGLDFCCTLPYPMKNQTKYSVDKLECSFYKSKTPSKLDLFSFNDYIIYNISKKDFNAAKSVILGHFTSSTFIDNIKAEGLLPQSKTGVEAIGGHDKEVDKEYIYLARKMDNFFIKEIVQKHGGNGILCIVEVLLESLEVDSFNPYLSLSLNKDDRMPTDIHSTIKETCLNFRTKVNISPKMILGIFNVADFNFGIAATQERPLSYTEAMSFPFMS